MYAPAQDLPDRSATERDFFKSRSYLEKHYGLELTDYRSLPYPYNLLMAEKELHRKLRVKDKYRHLKIMEQENSEICLTIEETFDEEFCLYYIPVMPIYQLWQNEAYVPCAELLTAVCAYLYAEAGISYYRDEDTYMYCNYEALEEWISDDWGDGEEDEYAHEKSALENAKIQGDFIQAKMMETGFRQSLDSLIANFNAVSEFEKDCLAVAQTCLKLGQEFPNANLFRHASLQDYEVEDYEDNYVGMHEYISFIGSINDNLSERLKSMVNDDFNERARYQEPEITTIFNEAQPAYTNELAYEQRAFGLIDDLCTLLYRKP
ncbi:hypothetical protein IDJ77_02055 [Mucilaginibacter sp. ZT4R22]|uniref:DUF4375 domain-containing protein n=1 Tax=Mucilaginibacter pankratovii TaxID=2772110 RepID=A0ABR7WJT9_9SPHI|nr:hypothetical protein [Mucilaginibacter pankratovii]MBD1362581.1 hypothetical protein [Mucilaginibacter pankratovii]